MQSAAGQWLLGRNVVCTYTLGADTAIHGYVVQIWADLTVEQHMEYSLLWSD